MKHLVCVVLLFWSVIYAGIILGAIIVTRDTSVQCLTNGEMILDDVKYECRLAASDIE